MKGISSTTTDNLSSIFSKPGITYIIPPFQRDYSWEIEHWEDLWLDIQELAINNEHYMGYIVLKANGKPDHIEVVDGQQRLTTLSILIIAVLRCLQDMSNDDQKERLEKIRKSIHDTYIGGFYFLDSSDRPKLILNRHLEDYYAANIVNTLGRSLPSHGRSPAEKALRDCYMFCYEKIKFFTEDELLKLVDNITKKLYFTIITVSNDANAYRLFETLNARGLSLSPADLLKNYLFQIVANSSPYTSNFSETSSLEKIWAEIFNSLKEEGFSDFLRAYWNSNYENFTRNYDLYRNIRNKIKTQESVREFLISLQEYAPLYAALVEPESNSFWDESAWKENKKLHDVKNMLQVLKLFNVKQPLPPLLVGLKKLTPEKFKTLVRDCLVISFRYNKICNKNPNEQETIYHGVAKNIAKSNLYDRALLKEIYPDDDTFMREFKNKSILKNKNLVKYTLYSIDNKEISTNIFSNSNISKITLEHIFPQNPDQTWSEEISSVDYEEYLDRLGNLSLLENTLHKSISSFVEKKEVYAKSQFKLTQMVAEYSRWSVKEIINRQEKMAKEAVALWRLEF
jgi:uncharacterized protein with ParB-like and HNH nuclease domain